jgi:phosphocarrier protein
MRTLEAVIVNKLGLHARPAAKVSQLAGRFKAEVWISKASRRINAKSIMGVMMLAAGCGSEIAIEVSGPDEEHAMRALRDLIDDKFGEGE